MNEIYFERVNEGRAYVEHGYTPDELGNVKGLVDRLTTTLELAALQIQAGGKGMKTSEFMKLRDQLEDVLVNQYGRDLTISEVVDWLMGADILDIAQVDMYLEGQ